MCLDQTFTTDPPEEIVGYKVIRDDGNNWYTWTVDKNYQIEYEVGHEYTAKHPDMGISVLKSKKRALELARVLSTGREEYKAIVVKCRGLGVKRHGKWHWSHWDVVNLKYIQRRVLTYECQKVRILEVVKC